MRWWLAVLGLLSGCLSCTSHLPAQPGRSLFLPKTPPWFEPMRPIGVRIDLAFSQEEREAVQWALDAWARALSCVRFVDGWDLEIRRAADWHALPDVADNISDTTVGLWDPDGRRVWLVPTSFAGQPLAQRTFAVHELGHMLGLHDFWDTRFGQDTCMTWTPRADCTGAGGVPELDVASVAQLHEACRKAQP